MVYFNHTIGLSGKNLDIIRKLNELRDGGRKHLIVMGDFNIHPDEWCSSGWLELLGIEVVTAGTEGTCRTVNGNTLIDYLLISIDIVKLIFNIRIIYAVPHWPHYGIAFDVNRRTDQIRVLKRCKPQPLPNSVDEK